MLFVMAGPLARGDEYSIRTIANPFFCKLDNVQQVLLCINDVESSTVVGAEMYDLTGHALLRVYPLKDFPAAKAFSVWDATATPDGGMAITGVLTLSEKEKSVRQLLLTYGKQGQLLKLWNVTPYHHHLLAADATGNIYAFGDRIDIGTGVNAPDYPLIVKYSPGGGIEAEFMPRKMFTSDVVDTNPHDGMNRMQIVGGELVLLLASMKEAVWFDLNGELERRVSLKEVLTDISTAYGTPFEIMGFAVLGSGGYLAQLRVQPKEPVSNVPILFVRISNDGKAFELIKHAGSHAEVGYLEGITSSGKSVFLKGGRANEKLLLVEHLK
jgi:hypothetical protein